MDLNSLRIETPSNLDSIFSLECFKYLEMKALFKQIFGHLNVLGNATANLAGQMEKMPNPDDIALIFKRLDGLDKTTQGHEKFLTQNKELIDKNKRDLIERIE